MITLRTILFFLVSFSAAYAKDPLLHSFYTAQHTTSLPCSNWKHLLPTIFFDTLVRLSGNTTLKDHPNWPQVISDTQRYVQDFQCQEQGPKQAIIRIRFNTHSIQRALTHLDSSIWPTPRASTLLWLYDNNSQHLLDREHPLYMQLQQHASQRGITLVSPLNDLLDQQILDEYINTGQITALQQRYQTH